jgi:hypothetical protein
VPNLRVAVTQRVQQDGQWRDGDTSFLKINVWRGQAEHLAESLSKGDRVMVTGRLRQRSWETPEGDKRSVTELEADEVGASLKWATVHRLPRIPVRLIDPKDHEAHTILHGRPEHRMGPGRVRPGHSRLPPRCDRRPPDTGPGRHDPTGGQMTNRVPAEHEESWRVAHKPCDSRLLTLPAAEVGTKRADHE